MGAKITHCGDSGNGLAVKIANNLLLGITMAGTA
jgi:3-hydroxyisobutyrate dehydrogenase